MEVALADGRGGCPGPRDNEMVQAFDCKGARHSRGSKAASIEQYEAEAMLESKGE